MIAIIFKIQRPDIVISNKLKNMTKILEWLYTAATLKRNSEDFDKNAKSKNAKEMYISI